jgi:hypothetical protein
MIGYAVIFGVAVLARLVLAGLTVEFVTPGQRLLWSWPVIVVLALALAGAAALADRARLPAPHDGLRWRSGLGLAIGAGAIVGVLTIASDIASPVAATRGLPTIHVQGIAALPFYLYGAILITVLFHFLPMATAAWVADGLPPAAARACVIAALLLVALSEDLGFFARGAGIATVDGGRHVLSVAANASEAALIYRYGLAAGLLQRGTTYLLWHLAWPNLSGS